MDSWMPATDSSCKDTEAAQRVCPGMSTTDSLDFWVVCLVLSRGLRLQGRFRASVWQRSNASTSPFVLGGIPHCACRVTPFDLAFSRFVLAKARDTSEHTARCLCLQALRTARIRSVARTLFLWAVMGRVVATINQEHGCSLAQPAGPDSSGSGAVIARLASSRQDSLRS